MPDQVALFASPPPEALQKPDSRTKRIGYRKNMAIIDKGDAVEPDGKRTLVKKRLPARW